MYPNPTKGKGPRASSRPERPGGSDSSTGDECATDSRTPAVADLGLGDLAHHDLRHTAASLAISAGASVKAVQRMLGHSSAQITLDRYTHLFEDDLESLAESRWMLVTVRPRCGPDEPGSVQPEGYPEYEAASYLAAASSSHLPRSESL